MLFGLDQYYQCPKCSNILYKGSLISGNTMGAKLYSDGKEIAPMLIEFPVISKCSKCNTIFWLENEIEIENHKDSEKAEFLTISDYQTALKNKLFRSKEEEIYIRKGIIWGFNDRLRNGDPLIDSESEKEIWTNNIQKLISLLDQNDLEEKILIIELLRYQGNFMDSLGLLETIHNPKLEWLVQLFGKEISNKNKNVFQLY